MRGQHRALQRHDEVRLPGRREALPPRDDLVERRRARAAVAVREHQALGVPAEGTERGFR